jgi:hypothetical protein
LLLQFGQTHRNLGYSSECISIRSNALCALCG